jgi:envelope integrity protein B
MTYLAFRYGWRARLGAALLCLVLAGQRARAAEEPVTLAPHRAVYDLTLTSARAGTGVVSVVGRLVYELTGSPCDGYTQKTRLVTQLTQQSGNTTLSDLRSTTWEDATGKRFTFESTQYRDEKVSESTAGEATRTVGGEEMKVELTKPDARSLFVAGGAYFPVQHTIALIRAARAGKASIRADLYDGSEKGDKVFDTVAALGRLQAPGANRRLPMVANAERLDSVRAWPVSIAFFEASSGRDDALPSYEISFWLFENGVSRKLSIDYGEFALQGSLKDLAFHEPTKCEPK